MKFWIFMLIMDLLLPFTMIGFGRYFMKKAPKEINSVFGYRTSMSMKNKDTWEFAHKYCEEIGLGIDFTARDVQNKLKEKGLPWEKAKAFDHSAVIGNFTSKKDYSSLENINFELKSNGVIVQEGNTNLMLWKIDELISYISQYFTLKIGDIIFTGTPKGVAKVTEGDVLEGFIEGKSMFKIQIR